MLAWLRLGLALSLALLAPSALVSRAHASCVSPPFELLWSYPADGATDVPINVQFWFLTTFGGNIALSLDGTALPLELKALNSFSATPEPLQPNPPYTLEIEATETDLFTHKTSTKRVEISFTTGGTQAAALPYAEIADAKLAPVFPSRWSCPKVVEAQDCFDTGQNAEVTFSFRYPDPERRLAWLIARDPNGLGKLWPATCGDPLLVTHESDAKGCYSVRSIGPGGLLSDEDRRCIGFPNGDRPAPVYDAGARLPIDLDASTSAPTAPDASATDAAVRSDAAGAPPQASPTLTTDAASSADASPRSDAFLGQTQDSIVVPADETDAACSAFPFARQTQSLGWWALLALAIARLLQRVRSHGPARHVLGRVSSRLHKRLYERASS